MDLDRINQIGKILSNKVMEPTDDFMAFGTHRETVNSEALVGVYFWIVEQAVNIILRD